jgi:hypothetical protein
MDERCPKCHEPLREIRYPSDSMLNRDQWKSQLPGDLFCTCHNNHKGNKPYAYFWKHELAAHPANAQVAPAAHLPKIGMVSRNDYQTCPNCDTRWLANEKLQCPKCGPVAPEPPQTAEQFWKKWAWLQPAPEIAITDPITHVALRFAEAYAREVARAAWEQGAEAVLREISPPWVADELRKKLTPPGVEPKLEEKQS